MKYKYIGYDRLAQKVSGEVEASNDSEAVSRLRNQNIRPLKLVPDAATRPLGGGADIGELLGLSNNKPNLYQFTSFIRQFATMQAAGIPIVQTLGVLAEQSENRGFGRTLASIQKLIEEGCTFTDALRRYPKVFDKIFINLIAAGEMSGSLDRILERLATYYEKSASLKRKIKSAMTYPIVVISLVFVVITVLLVFVVPVISQTFTSNGKQLPEATMIVMGVSEFVKKHFLVLFLGVVGSVFFIIFMLKDENVRRVLDPIFMKFPIFGDLIQKVGIARFSRTLGTMIQSGVPILDALEITSRVAGNYTIEDAIQKAKQSISTGTSISAPLAAANVFPKMAISMIAIGEQTGALDHMLTKIAEFYEDEVENKVGAISSLIEPLLIVIVGLVVACVLIPMYLPIFKLGEALSGS